MKNVHIEKKGYINIPLVFGSGRKFHQCTQPQPGDYPYQHCQCPKLAPHIHLHPEIKIQYF